MAFKFNAFSFDVNQTPTEKNPTPAVVSATDEQKSYHVRNIPAALGLDETVTARDVVMWNARTNEQEIRPDFLVAHPEFTNEVLAEKLSHFTSKKAEKAVSALGKAYLEANPDRVVTPLFAEEGLITLYALPPGQRNSGEALPSAQFAVMKRLNEIQKEAGEPIFMHEKAAYRPEISPTSVGYYVTHESVLKKFPEVAELIVPLRSEAALTELQGLLSTSDQRAQTAAEKKEADSVKSAAQAARKANPAAAQKVYQSHTEVTMARGIFVAGRGSDAALAAFVEEEIKRDKTTPLYMLGAATRLQKSLADKHETDLAAFKGSASKAGADKVTSVVSQTGLEILAQESMGYRLTEAEAKAVVPGLQPIHFTKAEAANTEARKVTNKAFTKTMTTEERTTLEAAKADAKVVISRTYRASPVVPLNVSIEERAAFQEKSRGQRFSSTKLPTDLNLSDRDVQQDYSRMFTGSYASLNRSVSLLKGLIKDKALIQYPTEYKNGEDFDMKSAAFSAKGASMGGSKSGARTTPSTMAPAADSDLTASRKRARDTAAMAESLRPPTA
jgi:hypothetical protein